MDRRYQRLDTDYVNRKSYSSIAPNAVELDNSRTSWLRKKCDKLLGSDKLVFFHEKQRAYKARQKPGVVQIFLTSIILFLIALFSIRALLSCGMFQTGKNERFLLYNF